MKAPQIESTVVNHTDNFFQSVGAISKYWSGREKEIVFVCKPMDNAFSDLHSWK